MNSISLYFYKSQVDKIDKYLNLAIEDINESINQIDKTDKDYFYGEIIEDVNKIEILELMIINLHKAVEKLIGGELKRLTKNYNIKTFQKDNVKKMFKQSFDIELGSLKNYTSYLELIFISNEIKHGNLINFSHQLNLDLSHGTNELKEEKKKYIKEKNVPSDLINLRVIDYKNLLKFYNRVKEEIFLFMEEFLKETNKK